MFLKYCATEDFDLNLTFRSVKQNYGAQFSEVQTKIQAGWLMRAVLLKGSTLGQNNIQTIVLAML